MSIALLNHKFEAVWKHVATALIAQGYSRTGATLRFTRDGNIAVINVQSGRADDDRALTFTINLGVACAPVLKQLKTYPRTLKHEECQVRIRLGELLNPPRPDAWWTIDAGNDVNTLAVSLVDALQQHALPFLARHLDTRVIEQQWSSGVALGLSEAQRLEYLEVLKRARSQPARDKLGPCSTPSPKSAPSSAT